MKSVLVSIKPKWYEKIASGETSSQNAKAMSICVKEYEK